MTECSPCVPQRACMTSPWAGSVGRPVLGPPRMTSTMTHGICAMEAKPIISCMRLKPGPEVAVSALAPAREAPQTAAMLRDLVLHLDEGAVDLRESPASTSAISVDGVIG